METLTIAWAVLVAVVSLTLIEVYLRNGDGLKVVKNADASLLLMILAMSVVIGVVNATGIPQQTYAAVEKSSFDLSFDTLSGVITNSVLVLVLSNVCSNVPTVMLLASVLQEKAAGETGHPPLPPRTQAIAWMTLSWVSIRIPAVDSF